VTVSGVTRGALSGRHAVVTGAGRGIGAAIAQALVSAGAQVSLLGRTLSSLEQTADACAAGRTHCVTADVTDPDAVTRALAGARSAFGPVAILVNNAGQAASAPMHKTSDALWEAMLASNLTGTFHCMRECLPEMVERDFGRIVNIASTAGLVGYRYVAAYCAAKHGVVGLTRATALEVATRNITVNAVCPGYTETDMLQSALDRIRAATGRSAEEARAQLLAANPQLRFITPAEVCNAVLWLCLPGSESITGQAIAVAGGEVSR
jgi:NAD(P)-dependent dehydrogenase (short-subunit alcohol dehydrogenase family)